MRKTPFWIGLTLGVVLLAVAFIMPGNRLEALVAPLGVDSLIAAAHPPLGAKARAVLGAVLFIVPTAIGWLLSRRGAEPDEPEPALDRAPRREMEPRLNFAARTSGPTAPLREAETVRPATPVPPAPPPLESQERPQAAMSAPEMTAPPTDAVPPARPAFEADALLAIHRRLDEIEERVAGQLTQIAQQLAEIAATSRQLARTPAAPPPQPAPVRFRPAALGDAERRERVARNARALRDSLPPLGGGL